MRAAGWAAPTGSAPQSALDFGKEWWARRRAAVRGGLHGGRGTSGQQHLTQAWPAKVGGAAHRGSSASHRHGWHVQGVQWGYGQRRHVLRVHSHRHGRHVQGVQWGYGQHRHVLRVHSHRHGRHVQGVQWGYGQRRHVLRVHSHRHGRHVLRVHSHRHGRHVLRVHCMPAAGARQHSRP